MNKNDINTIVQELIELDPTLKGKEDLLTKHVSKIIDSKPKSQISLSFKKKLLRELKTTLATTPVSTPSPLLTMTKFLYALSGAAVASIALFVTVIQPNQDSVSFDEEHTTTNNEMAVAEPAPVAYGRGGGGGGIPQMADSRMIALGEPYGMYHGVEYVYDGDIVLSDSKTLQGFKRQKLSASTKANVLEDTFVGGLLDLPKLGSLSMQQVTLSEKGDEPLMVSVDFTEGTIGINRQINYAKLPQNSCRDQNCWERFRLKQADMLSEDRTISIANDFLTSLGINTSSYGEPMLQDNWMMRYELSLDKANFYFPEQVTVTYPYLLNGTPVYDEWGNPNGMSVNVDIRLKTVVNLWGLRTANVEEIEYEQVTDEKLLRSAIRSGGLNAHLPEDADIKKANLSDPKQVFILHYEWDNDTQVGYESFVPALAFPVKTMPVGSFEARKAVVIPLAKEVLEKQQHRPMPLPMPMPAEPMMDPAATKEEVMMERAVE